MLAEALAQIAIEEGRTPVHAPAELKLAGVAEGSPSEESPVPEAAPSPGASKSARRRKRKQAKGGKSSAPAAAPAPAPVPSPSTLSPASPTPGDSGPCERWETSTQNCLVRIAEVSALVVGSDGVWDFMSPEEVATAVSHALATKADPTAAARAVVDAAVAAGSTDDVTAVVTWIFRE